MVEEQTTLSKKEKLLPPAPALKCQLGQCPLDATMRLKLNDKKLVAACMDLCDAHVRQIAETAKKGSYVLMPLSLIYKKRQGA